MYNYGDEFINYEMESDSMERADEIIGDRHEYKVEYLDMKVGEKAASEENLQADFGHALRSAAPSGAVLRTSSESWDSGPIAADYIRAYMAATEYMTSEELVASVQKEYNSRVMCTRQAWLPSVAPMFASIQGNSHCVLSKRGSNGNTSRDPADNQFSAGTAFPFVRPGELDFMKTGKVPVGGVRWLPTMFFCQEDLSTS